METLATSVTGAVREGHLSADTDPDQFAFELEGIMLSRNQSARLMNDARSADRARTAFEALVDRHRA